MNVLLTDQKSVYVSGWMKNQLPENCFSTANFSVEIREFLIYGAWTVQWRQPSPAYFRAELQIFFPGV